MEYIALYWEFIKIQFKTMLEYRGAFIVKSIGMEASYGAEFVLIWVMIHKFGQIGEWKPYEVVFLFAFNLISYSIAGFFLFHASTRLSGMIRTGDFDEILVRPLNSFMYMISRNFNPEYVSHITLSVIVMVICIVKLNIPLAPVNIILLFFAVLSSALIQGALFIFTSVPSFWTVNSDSLMHIFVWDLKIFIRYPLSIYNKFVQIFLTLVVPYAFINFYPAQYFLKKNDFLMFHPIFQFLSPIVGIIMFSGALLFWNAGIKRYESTGS